MQKSKATFAWNTAGTLHPVLLLGDEVMAWVKCQTTD